MTSKDHEDDTNQQHSRRRAKEDSSMNWFIFLWVGAIFGVIYYVLKNMAFEASGLLKFGLSVLAIIAFGGWAFFNWRSRRK